MNKQTNKQASSQSHQKEKLDAREENKLNFGLVIIKIT